MSEYLGKHGASDGGTSHSARQSSAGNSSRFSRKTTHSDERYRAASNRTNASNRSSASRFRANGPDDTSRPPYAGDQAFVGYTAENAWGARKPSVRRTVILVVVAVAVLGALAFGGFKLAQSFGLIGSDPPPSDGTEVSVFIPEGSSAAEIAGILRKAGVISRESSFVGAVQARGVENKLQPGKYTLRTGMTDDDVIDALLAGAIKEEEGNKLTIPEGLTLEATAARVEEVCGIPADEFITEAHSADKYLASYPFLEGVYNNSLEGFLYPKTYIIPEGSDAEHVIRVLLDQFAIETANLDLSYAASKNLTLYDLVIMGSMIEKETAAFEEYELVSSVLYNRLHEGMPLQICSTVVYAMGLENYDGHPLLESDLLIDSPYNTYQNNSLPAGPICSPRVETIAAAAHPAETDYFYYVLTSEEGTHTFCVTYEEFEIANAAYHELFNVPN
jgi:UPF0755 protein